MTKKSSHPRLGEIKISMYISPAIGGKPKWMNVPNVGTLTELQDVSSLNKFEDLNVLLVQLYYMKLRKATSLKLAFIRLMQNCVALTYVNKVPKWFDKKLKSKTSPKLINEYYKKAKRIFAAYLLYSKDAVDPKGRSRAAGHLLTLDCLDKIAELRHHENQDEKYQMNKMRSLLKFKSFHELKKEALPYENRLKSIWEIVDNVEQSQGDIFNSLMCTEHVEEFKEQVNYILSHPYGNIDFLLHGGYITNLQAKEEFSKMSQMMSNLHRRGTLTGETDILDKNKRASVQSTTKITGKFPIRKRSSIQKRNAEAQAEAAAAARGLEDAKPVAGEELVGSYDGFSLYSLEKQSGVTSKISVKFKDKSGKAHTFVYDFKTAGSKDSVDTALENFIEQNAGGDDNIPDESDSGRSMLEAEALLTEYLAKNSAFGMRRGRMMRHGPNHARRYMQAHRRGRGMNRFGRSPSLTQMTGYVRPYRTSAMEDYTGMTPSMYRRHLNSKTGTPMGRSARLGSANSYYGSYPLGEKLNPSRFGAPKKRRKTRKTPSKKKKPVKKKTTKKRKTPVKRRRRKSKKVEDSEFGNFFF